MKIYSLFPILLYPPQRRAKDWPSRIFAQLKKAGKDPHDIRRIIITHAHTDHTGSAAAISNELNIPVAPYRHCSARWTRVSWRNTSTSPAFL